MISFYIFIFTLLLFLLFFPPFTWKRLFYYRWIYKSLKNDHFLIYMFFNVDERKSIILEYDNKMLWIQDNSKKSLWIKGGDSLKLGKIILTDTRYTFLEKLYGRKIDELIKERIHKIIKINNLKPSFVEYPLDDDSQFEFGFE